MFVLDESKGNLRWMPDLRFKAMNTDHVVKSGGMTS
jgi:hypothetical protein